MYGPAMHALHCGKDREKTRANKRESARARETERGRERECVCESGRERGRENERASEGGRERARLGQQPQTLYPNLIDAVNDELHWRGVFSQLPRPVQPSFQTHAQSALRRPKKKQDKSHQSRSMPTHLERGVWLKCTKACVLVCVWLGLSVCSPENLFLSVLYNTVPEHICPLLSALPSPSESLSIKHHDAAPRRLHLVDSWSPRLASRLLRTKVHQGARAAKRGELCGGRVRRPGPRERRRAALGGG